MKAGRHVFDENEPTSKREFRFLKLLSIVLLIAAIVYLICPYDYDIGVVGKVDDFFFFMSAFCFVYSQFIKQARVALIMSMISVVCCFLGAVWLLLLVFMF